MITFASKVRRYAYIVLTVLGIVVGILAFAVIPQFANLYAEMGVVLPLPTKALVTGYSALGIAGVLLAAVGLFGAIKTGHCTASESPANVHPRRTLLLQGACVGSMGLIVFSIVTAQFYPLLSIESVPVQTMERLVRIPPSTNLWSSVHDAVVADGYWSARLAESGPLMMYEVPYETSTVGILRRDSYINRFVIGTNSLQLHGYLDTSSRVSKPEILFAVSPDSQLLIIEMHTGWSGNRNTYRLGRDNSLEQRDNSATMWTGCAL